MCRHAQRSSIFVNKHRHTYTVKKVGIQFTLPDELHIELCMNDNAVLVYSQERNYCFSNH